MTMIIAIITTMMMIMEGNYQQWSVLEQSLKLVGQKLQIGTLQHGADDEDEDDADDDDVDEYGDDHDDDVDDDNVTILYCELH